VLLAVLTWQVAGHGPAWRWDVRVDAAVLREAARHPGARPVAEAAADLGDLVVALPVLAAALAWAARVRREGRTALVCAALMAATGAVVSVAKAVVARPVPGTDRPAAHVVGHGGYFPSGHAAAWAMASLAAVVVLAEAARTAAARRALVCAAVPLQLVAGAGLVWRGYHWPLDVAASWCLCWVLLVVGLRFRSWWGTRG
jgi:membrane-associated phospholipid phosphatase